MKREFPISSEKGVYCVLCAKYPVLKAVALALFKTRRTKQLLAYFVKFYSFFLWVFTVSFILVCQIICLIKLIQGLCWHQ